MPGDHRPQLGATHLDDDETSVTTPIYAAAEIRVKAGDVAVIVASNGIYTAAEKNGDDAVIVANSVNERSKIVIRSLLTKLSHEDETRMLFEYMYDGGFSDIVAIISTGDVDADIAMMRCVEKKLLSDKHKLTTAALMYAKFEGQLTVFPAPPGTDLTLVPGKDSVEALLIARRRKRRAHGSLIVASTQECGSKHAGSLLRCRADLEGELTVVAVRYLIFYYIFF